jgi:hypothetical protein
MKTITISIQVPDGVNVEVNQGGGGNGRPFVARPNPPEPEGECPVHGAPWKLVQAGVSQRTGKPYNGFWVCSERGCDEKPGELAVPADWG